MADPTGSGSNGGTTTVVSNPPNPPTTNTVPNTTTNTTTVQYQAAIPDPYGVLAAEDAQLAAEASAQSDAEAFGRLSVPRDSNGVLAAEDAQLAEQAAARSDAEAYDRLSTKPGNLNDPYAGLSPTQLQDLGGADPTDPYIRARLGIPQLPGSTLIATSGFGFGNLTTNLPSIDNALGTIRSLFSGTIGSLFSNNVASNTAATTGSGVAALVAPVNTFTAQDTAGILAAEDAQLAAEAAAQGDANAFGKLSVPRDPNGVLAAEDAQLAAEAAAQGDAEAFGKLATSPASNTTLTADQADAFYNGTGTLTADQRTAQDQQTAADAAALYPGSNNTNLKNIDAAGGAIARNQIGIANAEQIIAENNAELVDPNISDQRRAELEANNASQENYIRLANDNTAEQELVIEANADGYAAGGGNPDSGQSPAEVAALTDPGLDQAIEPNIISTENANAINAAEDAALAEDEAAAFENQRVGPTDPFGVLAAEDAALAQEAAAQSDAEAFDNLAQAPTGQDPGPGYISDSEQIAAATIDAGGATDSSLGAAGEALFASRTANAKNLAKQQATIQARYKQPGNQDWRVRLSLGPGAQYLYNATPAGVLKPLAANGGTDGVIFPYTPNITTTYSANYEQYDLTHSNYRGIFYKNSRVGDIQLRGTFTAQDTTEANYLLAVIHFFRSVTKMFYGQDEQRGTPPPICLLNGYGGYQFSDHPVVVSSFNYSLPNDVDYIRTTNPNNFGLNLNNRYNPSGVSLPAGGALAGLNRLLNAIPGGLSKGALPRVPAPNTVAGSVTNNVPASYVPTKMEIDVTLIPVQTRSQVSQQFSLKGFANGDLLKGGFW